jgi:hypothetical protein
VGTPTPDELAVLQDPETWDWEHGQRGTPNPQAGISYRIRFQGDEVHAIDQAARTQGISEIEFIRRAALAAAHHAPQAAR